MAKIDSGQCLSLLQQAMQKTCDVAPAKTTPVSSASTADSLAAVADAIALATFALAIIVAFATVGWFVYVRHRTREEAKSEVANVAPAHIKAYLEANLPGMVAEAVAALSSAPTDPQSTSTSGDEQAKALSEDPR